MVISSLSHSTPSLPISVTLRSALDLPSSKPITPYTKHNPTHLAHAQSGLKKIDVPWTMSAEEAAGIWQIWAKQGWARGESVAISSYVADAYFGFELMRRYGRDIPRCIDCFERQHERVYERSDTESPGIVGLIEACGSGRSYI